MSINKCEIRYNTLSEELIIRHYEECGVSLQYLSLVEYAHKLKVYADLIELWLNGTLVGLCACYMNNIEAKVAFIAHIAILGTFRGKGFGEYLIWQVEQKAKSKGFVCMQLEVSSENTSACRFYKKMGYELKENRGLNMLMQKLL